MIDLTNKTWKFVAASQQISLQKKTYIHISIKASSQHLFLCRLRLRTESLNIRAPSKHLGLVLEYFTQELSIFYQAITIVCSGRVFSSFKSGTSSENKPKPLCCANNIHLLLLDFKRIPGFLPQTRAYQVVAFQLLFWSFILSINDL